MAKAAKSQPAETEVPDRVINKAVKDILDRYSNIETARGRYMNAARAERDAMATVYENLSARGIPQKAAKTEIKIIQLIEKVHGLLAELEEDNRKMVERMAKAQDDKKQLELLFDTPAPKTKREAKASEPPLQGDLESTETIGAA
jgi:hypothetical protein